MQLILATALPFIVAEIGGGAFGLLVALAIAGLINEIL